MRSVAWVFAAGAFGYFLILAATVYGTHPFRFGWANNPPEYVEMLAVFSVPLVVCTFAAAALFLLRPPPTSIRTFIIAVSVFACATILFMGWGLVIVPLAAPTILLLYRVRA